MDRNLARWGESPAIYDKNVEWQRNMFVQRRDDSFQVFVQAYSEADDATMAAMFPPRG